MYKLLPVTCVLRLADGASIPNDPQNEDYAAYLLWIAAGNVPTPADIPDPKILALGVIASIERDNMLPRHIREFMLKSIEASAIAFGATQGLLADQALGILTQQNPGYRNVKALDTQITALRATTK